MKELNASSKGTLLGTPNREPQEYSRNIMEYKDPSRYIPIICLLYSWGSLFGVPSRVPLSSSVRVPGRFRENVYMNEYRNKCVYIYIYIYIYMELATEFWGEYWCLMYKDTGAYM